MSDDGETCPIQIRRREHEHAQLLGAENALHRVPQPGTDGTAQISTLFININLDQHQNNQVGNSKAFELVQINVIANAYLIDAFLDGEFSTYGLDVLKFLDYPPDKVPWNCCLSSLKWKKIQNELFLFLLAPP